MESFQEVWENGWMDGWMDGWMESLMIDRAESTVNKKGYTLKSLLDFQNETGYKLTFQSINDIFAEEYKKWALTARTLDGRIRYQKDNSIHKNISITKEFMNWANKRGYANSLHYKHISGYNEEYFAPFALSNNDVTLMQLDFELIDLGEFGIRPCNQLKVKEALERTRDAFVFRCLCGIRYSDYDQLTPEKLQNGSLQLVTQKTNTQINLPLHSYAKHIIAKHRSEVPKFRNQNENENLKLLAKIAGFTQEIMIPHKRGGRKIEIKQQRWELVSTYTARKTFITNCLRAGIRDYVIMEIVGIKKMATFQRFVQVFNFDINEAMEKQKELYH